MSAFLSSLLGATLAFLAQIAMRGWQYKHEHWVGRAQTFVELTNEIAEIASSYWCCAQDEAKAADTRTREAEIIGKLARLDRLLPSIAPHLQEEEKSSIKEAQAAFFDAVSGGDFGSPVNIDAQVGGDRARLIHVSAAELVGSVHDALDNALRHNFWGRALWK